MRQRLSFTFETVMSDPAKVELLKEATRAGYRTYLYYICTETSVINLGRVAARVAAGGHSVPEGKVTERYDRSLSLLLPASKAANRAFVWDNSEAPEGSHRLIATFDDGRLTAVYEPVPGWFSESVLGPLNHETRGAGGS